MSPFRDDELFEVFKMETEVRLKNMEDGLLRLEKNTGDHDLAYALFREAHSEKGAARIAGIKPIEELSLAIEDHLEAVCEKQIELDDKGVELLFRCIDTIRSSAQALFSGEAIPEGWQEIRDEVNRRTPNLENETDKKPPAKQEKKKDPKGKVKPRQETPEESRQGREESQYPANDKVAGESPSEEGDERKTASTRRTFVRVRADYLSDLLDVVEELSVLRSRNRKEQETSNRANSSYSSLLDSRFRVLRDGFRALRLESLSELFQSFPRFVRDASVKLGKKANIEFSGEGIQMEREVVDALKDPLLHLINNALDHGIESPEKRMREGKSPTGRLWLDAHIAGNTLRLIFGDDGGGIDEGALLEKGRARKLDFNSVQGMSPVEVCMFSAGVSTAKEGAELSGRGVGLSAVRERLLELGGTIGFHSHSGMGCEFVMEIPYRMTAIESVVVQVGGVLIAFPAENVIRLSYVDQDDLVEMGKSSGVDVDGSMLPLLSLGDVFGFEHEVKERLSVVSLGGGGTRVAVRVDSFVGRESLVVRPFDARLGRLPMLAGHGVLDDGRVVLMAEPEALLAHKSISRPLERQSRKTLEKVEELQATVLIVEDSITTRVLERNLISAAGYKVIEAGNGVEALRRLGSESVDCIVTDIQMPRMDGLELIQHIRADEKFKNLPVIVVSARGADEERKKGLDLGADAYIVKTDFEQGTLLDSIRRLI